MKKGFTLIELLVVIAIIGILASVILVGVESARAKARNARRFSDIKQVQNALEMYHADNGVYPSTGMGWWGECSGYGARGLTGASAYIPNLAPTYIPVLPQDPKKKDPSNCYLYKSDGIDYAFLVHHTYEGTTPSQFIRPNIPTPADVLFVYTPGARLW